MKKPEKKRTLKKEALFRGKGIHTGQETELLCRPAPCGTGIVFRRSDASSDKCLRLGEEVFQDDLERRSAIGRDDFLVQTQEHFLAALWALGIDNLEAEIKGEEIPAMDGSAIEFIEKLKLAGLKEQEEDRTFLRVRDELTVTGGESSISIIPYEGFAVSYLIDYDLPSIKKENFIFDLNSESFEEEIAPARTFCMKREARALLDAGLGKGATVKNTLVMDEGGPVDNALRFSNEPVRHKVLDLVGDMYLLGVPLLGKIEARRSGHRMNLDLVKKIYRNYMLKGAER